MERRVLITGLNMVTPLGVDRRASWEKLAAGQNGVRRISLFDASGLDTQIAAEVPEEFDAFAQAYCSRRMSKQMGRAIRFGYVCAKAAIQANGLDFNVCDKMRCAAIFGAADTGHSAIYDDKYWILKTMPHGASAWLSMEYGLEGPNYTVSAACASSAYAVAHGYDLIQSGRADVVIAGGASAIVNPEHVRAFNEVGALSVANGSPETASRPFSLGRDGFVIGEGAGVLILEAGASAEARRADVFAEVAGYAVSSEGHNLMAPRPEGAGMEKTMRLALQHAGVRPEQVGYINAHGSSTPLNDKYETRAIERLFGPRAAQIPVSSTKSMIGHTAAACGAIEAAVTALSLSTGILTPTINHTPDPELTLDYVPHCSRVRQIDVAISNSFGFGGCNATLVLKRFVPPWKA